MVLIVVGLLAVVTAVAVRLLRGGGDLGQKIVDLSAARLAETRPEWARAMSAELSVVEGRIARLRFAAGCAWVATVPPVAGARRVVVPRAAIGVVAAGLVVLGAFAQQRVLSSPAVGEHRATYEIAAALLAVCWIGLNAWSVDRQIRQATPRAATARRTGIAFGVVLGAVALAVSLPPADRAVPTPLALGGGPALVAAGSLLAAVTAARANRDAHTGYQAGLWAGRIAGTVMATGMLAATLWATGWFTHDPAVISSYRDTFTAADYGSYHTHFDTISGYVFSENLDAAIIGALIMFPILGFVFGALGGAIGTNARRGQAT